MQPKFQQSLIDIITRKILNLERVHGGWKTSKFVITMDFNPFKHTNQAWDLAMKTDLFSSTALMFVGGYWRIQKRENDQLGEVISEDREVSRAITLAVLKVKGFEVKERA